MSEPRLERDPLERPQSRAYVGRPFLFSFFFSSRVLIASYSTTQRPSSSQHKTTYASQSQSFPPSLPHSFIFPFFYTSRLTLKQHLSIPRHYHAAAVRSFFYLALVLPLCAYTSLFIFHHRHTRGCRYDTKLDITDR